MADLIQLRRDSKANWELTNPILAEGELGIETDTRKQKVGDGISHWNNLPYMSGSEIDDEPTVGSDNLVKSGGVWNDSTAVGTNKLGWTDRSINISTGYITSSSNRKLSELINITKYKPYTVVSNSALWYCVCYFDVNKDFISGEGWIYSNKNLTNDAPQGTVYVRIMVNTDKADYENLYVYSKGTWLGGNIGDIIFQNILPQETIQESAYFTVEIGSFNLDGSYNSNNSYFRLHNPIESYDLISMSCVSGYKLTIYGNNEGLNHNLTRLATWITNYNIPYAAYKYYFVIGKRDDGEIITSADDLTSIILVNKNINNGSYIPASSKEDLRQQKNYLNSILEIFDREIESTKEEVSLTKSLLPQEREVVNEILTMELGGYIPSTGMKSNSNTNFRNITSLKAQELISISCANGYKISLWGNNEGYGHEIYNVVNWPNSPYSLDNFPYNYMFIVGKKSDNSTITSQDDLTNIISLTKYQGDGNYKNCAAKTNLIIVDAKGKGDYTSLQDAIYNAGDSAENPKTILVMPGVYEMAQYNETTRRFGNNRYLSIIGTDKNNCIIMNNVGHYTTSPYVDNACLKLAGNVYIANLTIISTDENYPSSGANDRHKAYCVHLDFAAPENTVCEINNCVLVNNHFSCIGFGLKKNYTIKIVDCEMIATMHSENGLTTYGTLYGHDGINASDSEIQQHLFVKGCVITNTNGDYGITYINSYNKLTDLTLINNIVDVPQGDGFKKSSLASLTKKCFGNNISSMNY